MSSSAGSPDLRHADRDEDGDIRPTVESDNQSLGDEEDADLFGSDDEEPINKGSRTQRKLDDEELDSGDDIERTDREPVLDDHGQLGYAEKEEHIITQDANLHRMKDPEVTDNDLYLCNLPPFLGIERENFDPATYIPPSQPHTGQAPEGTKFSPYDAAASSLFWRHDPTDPSRLQSSSRIIRWSDGSLTLQLASTPKDQYKISATALRQVPPNAKKPLPVHTRGQPKVSQNYEPNRDAHVYLAAAHPEGSMYRIVSPVTASLKVLPTGLQNDDAMLRLQSSLAKVAPEESMAPIREIKEDPELARKRAELAEKEKLRAQRRRENQEQKDFDRKKTVFGRRGVRSSGVGLSIGDLEGDDFDGDMRPTKPKKPKRQTNRRGEIYTDDEDEGYGRGNRNDEYDEDDGFLVGSDEEPEVGASAGEEGEEGESDPDVDDLEIEGRQTVLKERSRAGAAPERAATPPKRREVDMDDEPARESPQARKRGKRVVESDEEE